MVIGTNLSCYSIEVSFKLLTGETREVPSILGSIPQGLFWSVNCKLNQRRQELTDVYIGGPPRKTTASSNHQRFWHDSVLAARPANPAPVML